jgi:hypothetical protein
MPKQSKTKPKQLSPPSAPQRKEIPDPALLPRGLLGIADAPDTGNPDGAHPSWRLALLDLEHDGSWSWKIGEGDLKKIIAFLTEMERLTWAQVKAQMTGGKRAGHRTHHSMLFDSLCPEAKRRLRECQLEGFDLFRFRLSQHERLWGVIYDEVFYPVWWDANHEVYPLAS